MRYDIYFHNDFDGFASAAMLLNFLRSRGDDLLNYYPVDYPLDLVWLQKKFIRPTAGVDFQYHPGVKIWFDHHPTAFFKDKWKADFRPKKLARWNSDYKSCCHLIFDSIINEFDFNPPKFLAGLTRLADKVDGAMFSSPKEALNLNLAINQFDLLLDCLHLEFKTKKGASLAKKLVDALSSLPFEKAVRPILSTLKFRQCLKRFYKSMDFYAKSLVQYGNTVFIDTTKDKKVIPLHLAPFYYYPKMLFTIRLVDGDRGYGLGVGSNPWKRPSQPVNIGRYLKESFGGGGHPFSAKANFKTKKDAISALPKILKFLNTHK